MIPPVPPIPPSECDHPGWREAMTYRQLLKQLIELSEEQLDSAVSLREPTVLGGSTNVPIHGFIANPREQPILTRVSLNKPTIIHTGNVVI